MSEKDEYIGDALSPYNDPVKAVWSCHKCKQPMRKSYCAACDEFYNTGHTATCSERLDRGVDHERCFKR